MANSNLLDNSSIYFQTGYLTIENCASRDYGVLIWQKFVKGAEFREALQAVLKFLQEYPVHKLIIHTRDMGGILPVDRIYLDEVFVPDILKTGISHMAVVVSESMFNELAIRKIMDKNAKNITAYFKTPEDARRWIEHL